MKIRSALAASLGAVALLASGVVTAQAADAPADDLQGSIWLMTHVDGSEPIADHLRGKVTMQFRPHSLEDPSIDLIGFGGCNIFNAGVFDLSDEQISGVSTPVTDQTPDTLCDVAGFNTQNAYFDVLASNPEYFIQGDSLTVYTPGYHVLTFERGRPTR